MKNSYRNFPVCGTSALKCNASSNYTRSNVVEFPAWRQVECRNSNHLRIQRKVEKADKQTKIDIFIAFAVGCLISYGTVFSMIAG